MAKEWGHGQLTKVKLEKQRRAEWGSIQETVPESAQGPGEAGGRTKDDWLVYGASQLAQW